MNKYVLIIGLVCGVFSSSSAMFLQPGAVENEQHNEQNNEQTRAEVARINFEANTLVFNACAKTIMGRNQRVFDVIWDTEKQHHIAEFTHSWQQFGNRSLLAAALETRNQHIAKKLLDAGARIEQVDCEKNSAFDYVSTRNKDALHVTEEKKELIRLLLNYCDPVIYVRYAWIQAAKGDVNFFEVLYEKGFDFNVVRDEKGTDLLIQAMAKGQIELVKYLSGSGVYLDINHLHAATDSIRNFDRLRAAEKERESLDDERASKMIRERMRDVISYLCSQGLRPSSQDFIGQADDIMELLEKILKNKNKNFKKKAQKRRAKEKKVEEGGSIKKSDDNVLVVTGEEQIVIPALSVQRKNCDCALMEPDHDTLDNGENEQEGDDNEGARDECEKTAQCLIEECNRLYDLLETAKHPMEGCCGLEKQAITRELTEMIREGNFASRIIESIEMAQAKEKLEQLEALLDLGTQVTIVSESFYTAPNIFALFKSLLKVEHKNSIRALTRMRQLIPKTTLFLPTGTYSGYELLLMLEEA